MKSEKRISPTVPGERPAGEVGDLRMSGGASKRDMLDKLLARGGSNPRGGEQGSYRATGPGRVVRWSLAAVLGLAALSLPLPAQALFAPAPVHKALYHLDEGSGTSTSDAASRTNACLGSSLANPCPTAGASSPTWTPDARYGSALRFDGVDDSLTFAHSASLDWAAKTNNHVVIEAWIKPAKAGTILSKGGSASHNYRLAIDPAGNLIFSYRDIRGKLRQLASPLDGNQAAPVSFGQWHWVSVSFSEDYNKVEMRVDGGMNDQKSSALTGGGFTAPDPRTNTAPLSIGSFGGAADFFGGVIDELRISITPDTSTYRGGYPQVGSDRGLVLSRAEFAPASGPDFFELHRPDLGDGAAPVSLSVARIYDADNNEYEVPFSGACVTGDRTCYLVSPGETVRVWLNGAGPAMDTASTTFSEWYTSNCSPSFSNCALGDGGPGQDLGPVDLLHLRTTGTPHEAGGPRYLLNADVVVWGADQSTNPFFMPMVTPEGLWPGTVEGFRVTSAPFVETAPGSTGIALITLGNNLAGPAAWG